MKIDVRVLVHWKQALEDAPPAALKTLASVHPSLQEGFHPSKVPPAEASERVEPYRLEPWHTPRDTTRLSCRGLLGGSVSSEFISAFRHQTDYPIASLKPVHRLPADCSRCTKVGISAQPQLVSLCSKCMKNAFVR